MTEAHTPHLPLDIRVLERGWLSSNNIVCLGNAPAIIDTGHTKHAAETVALVSGLLGSQTLAAIAHTHLHSDHCGGTGALQAAWPHAAGVTWVPQPSLPHVQAWDQNQLTFDSSGQRCERFEAHLALVPGQTVRLGAYDWEIHAAPGHDDLAVLLYERTQGLLIAGDAMWEHSVGVIFPQVTGTDDFDPFLETLQLIETLNPKLIIPGHGSPFTQADGSIDAALSRARQRIAYFKQHPTQHALYAAKVMIKYQLMDVESMTHTAFDSWINAASLMHLLHQQHRPDLSWDVWSQTLLDSMVDKGTLRRNETHVLDGR